MSSEIIVAPTTGEIVPLDRVADKIFSSGALGPGAGIIPDAPVVAAPVSGTVVTVMPHAYGIRTKGGADVLVHIGIDTVELEGRHFEPQVSKGDWISQGSPLAVVDTEAVRTAGYDTTVLVVLTNSKRYGDMRLTSTPHVNTGDPFLTLDPLTASAT